MRLVVKRVFLSAPRADILKTIKSFAYAFPEPKFTEESFSMRCSISRKMGCLFLLPIKGTIKENAGLFEVSLELHAGIYFYIGCIVSLLGAVLLLWHFFFMPTRWVPSMCLSLLGIIECARYLYEGNLYLNRIKESLAR